MCGIAGIIAWDETYRVTRERLLAMSAAIAHRGPDGEGIWLTRENEPITLDTPQVGFAFRRLAILDPDPRAMQPFTIGTQTIVFNGEIYNYRELRDELTKLRPDYVWRTTGDTEVLLLGYSVWKENCLDKLNGMFAFAIWDEADQSLLLARDRMGQKPLYFAQPHGIPIGTLAFASELPALQEIAWADSTIQISELTRYLKYGYSCFRNPKRGTAFDATIWNRWRKSRSVIGGFVGTTESSPPSKHQETRALVEQAVHRQLVSDVPLGVFLSGGVDSSIVALCARQLGAVKTFSIAFDDPRYDESEYAQRVADHLKTDHHVFNVTPDVIADLPKIAAVFGEPFADSSVIPTYYLCRETRKHVKVALSGDGGDELFGGYDRYRAMAYERMIRALPERIRVWLTRRFSTTASHPKSLRARWSRFAQSLNLPIEKRYGSYLRFFSDAQLHELLLDSGALAEKDLLEDFYKIKIDQGRDPVRAALATDRKFYLPEDLLAKVDRCSMLNSLEVRSPFMDHELVQFATGLTTKQLLKGGGKRMLREAFAKDLPRFVFKRKKMGFAVPIGEWFRGPLRDMLRDYLFAKDSFASTHFNPIPLQTLVDDHERGRADHSQRLFALLMLELSQKTA